MAREKEQTRDRRALEDTHWFAWSLRMATLSHSEFGVPYGPLAVALLRGADLSPKPDAAMARDAIPFMTFPSG